MDGKERAIRDGRWEEESKKEIGGSDSTNEEDNRTWLHLLARTEDNEQFDACTINARLQKLFIH